MGQDIAFKEVINQLPGWFHEIAKNISCKDSGEITEIRIWQNRSIGWIKNGRCFFLNKNGRLEPFYSEDFYLTQRQIQDCFYSLCKESVHTFQHELCQGFIPLEGGHRAGICGTAVMEENHQIGIRNITSVNLRIAREKTGCSQYIFETLFQKSNPPKGVLIAGPPASGKTTILRDLVRCLSGHDSYKITAVIDERGEISGQDLDLGITSHILREVPKVQGILQALRTLSPDYMVCDEIGTVEEAELLSQCLHTGTGFIGTIHAGSWEELKNRPVMVPMMKQKILDCVVILSGSAYPGTVEKIIFLKGENTVDSCNGMCPDFHVLCRGRLVSSNESL